MVVEEETEPLFMQPITVPAFQATIPPAYLPPSIDAFREDTFRMTAFEFGKPSQLLGICNDIKYFAVYLFGILRFTGRTGPVGKSRCRQQKHANKNRHYFELAKH